MSTTDDGMDWDAMASSTFMKFETPGDVISGVIVHVRPGTDFNGNPCPVLDIETEDDGIRSVTCGQWDLKQQVVAMKPKAGNAITILYDHNEPLGGGKSKKVFVIDYVEHTAPVTADEPPF